MDVGNDQYWEQFAVQPSDLEYLANFLVESERPQTLEELATELTRYRHAQITQVLDATLSQGTGLARVKPMRRARTSCLRIWATARACRSDATLGHNPEYEPFTVVQVEDGRRRYARVCCRTAAYPHSIRPRTLRMMR